MERYIATQFYKADSPESRILGESGLVPSEFVLAADAQRALDAEREKVKELVANQAEYEKCTDEQITALNQGCLDYEKQIATLQAQLADRDAMILQMGEQAAVLAKENMAVKAQLRQVEGERDHAKKMEAVQKEVADNQTWHVQKLKDWRDTVTLALQRPGGARFEDVPEHIKGLVRERDALSIWVNALRDSYDDLESRHADMLGDLTTLRQLVEALINSDTAKDHDKAWFALRATLAAKDAPHPTEERS